MLSPKQKVTASRWIRQPNPRFSGVRIWFVDLVASVDSGVVIGIAFLVLAFVLVIPGALLWWALGPGAVTLGYTFIASTAVFLLLFVMGPISNAFSWSYWSLGYLRMVEEEAVPAA